MHRTIARAVAALLFVGALIGCATTPAPSVSGTGVVQSIRETEQASTGGSIVGAIGGSILGSWLGGQVGGGFGRTVAATAGGIGGSMAGSAMGAQAGATTVWVVSIRFEDGIDRALTMSAKPGFRPGDRVRVGDGVITRETQ